MTKFILFIMLLSISAMAEGVVDIDVKAGQLLDSAYTSIEHGDQLSASKQYRLAGIEYAKGATKYKELGLPIWKELHKSANECYANALSALDTSNTELKDYYRKSIINRMNDLAKLSSENL